MFTPVWTELSALGLPGLGPSVLPEAQTATDTWSLSFTDSGSVATITDGALSVSDSWSLTLLDRAYSQSTDQLGVTELRSLGLPGFVALFDDKAFTSSPSVAVSDTWSLSWTEDPVNLVLIAVSDTWRLTYSTESAAIQVFQTYAIADTWSLQFLDAASVFSSGVIPVAVSDTWSLSFTDSAAISVAIGVSDTWSLSFTDSGSVAITQDPIDVSDTWSLAFSGETGGVTIVATISKIGSDTWTLSFIESARSSVVVHVASIRMEVKVPRITFEQVN